MHTPCISICLHDPASGLCRGCGRTLQEIEDWMDMSAEEQLRIMKELPGRLQAAERRSGKV